MRFQTSAMFNVLLLVLVVVQLVLLLFVLLLVLMFVLQFELLLVLLLEVFRQGGTSTEEEAFRTEPVKRSRIHNCPNQCSSNGYCKSNCTCFPGTHIHV